MDNNTKKSKEDWASLSEGNKQIEQMKKMLQENYALTKDIHKMTKKINNFVIMSRVFSVLKILLIVVPLVLGILYLPPLFSDLKPMINEAINGYKEILGISRDAQEFLNEGEEGETINLGDIDVNQMSPELRELLKKK